MHRTANGKMVDMNALRTKNEHVRAVGNMNVNSRGDIIDSDNKVINDNNKRMNSMYNKTIANPPQHKQTQRPPIVQQQENFAAQPQQIEHIPDDFDNDVVIVKK